MTDVGSALCLGIRAAARVPYEPYLLTYLGLGPSPSSDLGVRALNITVFEESCCGTRFCWQI